MKKGKWFIIRPDVFPFQIMVSIDEPEEVLIERLRGYSNKEEELQLLRGEQRGRCVILPSNQTIIKLKTQNDSIDMICTVAHECLHAVIFILERMGMQLSTETSDEAYCYFHEYLVKEVMSRL
jgi:hypothetical protein